MNPHTLYQSVTDALNLTATIILIGGALGFLVIVPAVLILNGMRGRKIR